jgi:malto-oligosyltrehalose trehalohydrolase
MITQAFPAVAGNPHGAEIRPGGSVRFRLWAPAIDRVQIEILGQGCPIPMESRDGGWHEWITEVPVGTRYRFVLADGLRVPDPASRYQPEDVHGPSELVDTGSWPWSDSGWAGRPWEEAVVYEMHVGAFTPEGTFRAAIGKLDHLASLGVTAIELMPIADFPGRWNWGYDGVLPYAPDSSYGRPEDLKALVEAAHERGIMVFLDVVYNHFGPDGNYLPLYAPQFFNARRTTPWGPAVNFDGPGSRAVRDFFLQNAIYWLSQYHIDGLRLDAVHAILDDSAPHFLEEFSERIRAAAGARPVHLILENEDNQACRLERDRTHTPAFFTAQWNDDVHHVLHTAVTCEDEGYYGAYRGSSLKLGRALAEGFAFQGEWMEYRGSERGEPCGHLPPTAFVAFLQNHDQVGNRAFGDRITRTARPEAVRAAAAVYLLLPQIPMDLYGRGMARLHSFPVLHRLRA